MTHATDPSNLDELGDALTAATERDLHRGGRRPVRRIALVLAALAIVTAGTAAAAGLFSPKQVAQGMPAGAAIFDQTDPSCVANADGASFRCSLSSPPAPEVSDFSGTKEVLAIDGVAAGGCIGLDAAGMTWDCYIGQDAVDHDIISQDFLGEPVLGPGHG
ncbi:MAG TPA: hypothetical protein VFW02_04350 [Candidatus Limnocylindrales bacterium]|nr:hypothetical protein [Candidatus Limnocylindrales bacterium]